MKLPSDLIITSNNDLDGLISNFRYLCCSGYKTSLNISSENGRAVVDFHVDLGFIQPPVEVPPPNASYVSPEPLPKCHRSPSYYRRLRRRRAARASLNDDILVHSSPENGNTYVDKLDAIDCEAEESLLSSHHSGFPDVATGHENVSNETVKENVQIQVDCNGKTSEDEGDNVQVICDKTSGDDDVKVLVEESESRTPAVEVRVPSTSYSMPPPLLENESAKEVIPFDAKLSAVENLRNLTLRLDAMKNHSYYDNTVT